MIVIGRILLLPQQILLSSTNTHADAAAVPDHNTGKLVGRSPKRRSDDGWVARRV